MVQLRVPLTYLEHGRASGYSAENSGDESDRCSIGRTKGYVRREAAKDCSPKDAAVRPTNSSPPPWSPRASKNWAQYHPDHDGNKKEECPECHEVKRKSFTRAKLALALEK